MSPDLLKSALRAYMTTHDLSMTKLSERAGLSPSTVKKFLASDSQWPRLDTAAKLVALLGMTLEEAVNGPSSAGAIAQRLDALDDADRQLILSFLERAEAGRAPLALPAPPASTSPRNGPKHRRG